MKELAKKQDKLAKRLVANWENPISFIFLTPDGQLISKMKTSTEFQRVHGDTNKVGLFKPGGPTHLAVFLNHLADHFGENEADNEQSKNEIAADQMLVRAHDMLCDGKSGTAKNLLRTVLHSKPGTAAAKEAERILQYLDAKRSSRP